MSTVGKEEKHDSTLNLPNHIMFRKTKTLSELTRRFRLLYDIKISSFEECMIFELEQ